MGSGTNADPDQTHSLVLPPPVVSKGEGVGQCFQQTPSFVFEFPANAFLRRPPFWAKDNVRHIGS